MSEMTGSSKQIAGAEDIIARYDREMEDIENIRHFQPELTWTLSEWEAAKAVITAHVGATGWIELQGVSMQALLYAPKVATLPKLTRKSKIGEHKRFVKALKIINALKDQNAAMDAIAKITDADRWLEYHENEIATTIRAEIEQQRVEQQRVGAALEQAIKDTRPASGMWGIPATKKED